MTSGANDIGSYDDKLDELDIYFKAKKEGEEGKDCAASYPACPMSLLNILTNIISL